MKKEISGTIYFIFCIATAMIGYTIHGDTAFAVIDFFFAPLVWAKWFVFKEVNITIIWQTFEFFFR